MGLRMTIRRPIKCEVCKCSHFVSPTALVRRSLVTKSMAAVAVADAADAEPALLTDTGGGDDDDDC